MSYCMSRGQAKHEGIHTNELLYVPVDAGRKLAVTKLRRGGGKIVQFITYFQPCFSCLVALLKHNVEEQMEFVLDLLSTQ